MALPRRSASDALAGLAATVLLLALLAGVPAALVTVLGSPIPHSLPPVSLLTQRLGIEAMLRILSLVIWLAWLQLAVCVVTEVRAAVRNTGMPPRVPLAGGLQPAVHRLVTAALLLFSAATALSPAVTHAAQPAVAITAGAGTARTAIGPGGRSGPPAALPARPAAASPSARPARPASRGEPAAPLPAGEAYHRVRRTEKIYVVQPPVGRYHESLWEIAENHLGDGRRYREIFELNKDRMQPDGGKLTIASLIRPGWILRMPRDAYGPGIRLVTLRERGAKPAPATPAPATPAPPTPAPAPATPAPATPATPATPAPATPARADPASAASASASRIAGSKESVYPVTGRARHRARAPPRRRT
jgi:hypothetical protein